ncbi:centrosome-associated zinc finger protein CP190 [Drosophila gunungcola]|uniref:Centrosome-associated zinc finger protein CP190 n=1 Tax=Drosophila gunungcola TaxID=103775 RepID=A0A9P9YX82_9MUSC|nr:centrosome-associated zinc finger protein CP190 [Drosophila gunungcola]KAI8044580.1 hypothetical protein M5D96_000750 [Drosophila gunungcola]
MGEVKSVKVDNWGVFFLQKLQNFFNKTDYCDLTLQFRDNSQLKVHRLVLSACTDYFNVLEQTCEIVDDALIMPNEFQADVVVPIVNFMYTGTLEFELKMYGKLLRTAKEMNMTVLLKLLEAHRRTMENVNRQQRPPSPKGIRRRTVGQPTSGLPQQRVLGPSPQSRNVGTPTMQRANTQRGPTGNTMIRTSGGTTRSQYAETTVIKQEPTSPFEQLRKGYNNNKRPAQTSLLSPPSKKPSLEEVKEFAEQQRMRKQIAAEYGDHDPEYDGGMLYDDVHAGDDDDDDLPLQPSTSKQQSPQGTQTQLEHGSTTIILKQDSPSQTPTIIVKDSSNAKLNHTKIIAEVLRQYPHIVKGHKNIKLKIMPNTPPASAEKSAPAAVKRGSPAPSTQSSASTSPHKKLHVSFKADKNAPLITTQQKAATSQQKTAPTQSIATQGTATNPPVNAAAAQKRRIDSKTMHALIAQGAENTTGPWLCLRCGVNGRPISIPSYRGFRRHLINTHKETIDPALCEHCGWRSGNNRALHFHMYTDHQVKSMLYTFAECALCNQSYLTKGELETHINEAHTDDNKQQCIYCNKVFEQELQLYRHMKSYHKEQALEDGIIDETDEEFLGSQDEEEEEAEGEEEQEPEQTGKVRILSDISLPATSAIAVQQAQQEQLQEEDVEHEQVQQEVKFVGADGNEVELTDEQRKEILSQLNQQQAGAAAGGVVMVLSEPEAEPVKQETDEKSLAGTEEEYDDSQIYTELAAADSVESAKKSVADESKESMDNLEWAENLIAESEEQSNKEPKLEKSRDDISEKLKELTGDWTEDENEDDVDDQPATTELASELAAKHLESTANEEEEDAIDLALQSLHKGHEDQAVAKTNEDSITSAEEAVIPSASTNSQPEKMVIDSEAVNEKDPKSVVTIKQEKGIENEEEEFIKEDTPIAEPEPEVESSEAVATAEGDDEVHLEADNIRKELLDELIAEAEKPNQEKSNVKPGEDSTTVASDPPLDSAVTDVDELVPPTQMSTDQLEADEQEVEKLARNNDKTTTTEEKEVTEDKPNKSGDASVLDSATLESVAEGTTAGEAASVEKVKSLISEWGDDDEEDEDENGVSAAAKEEL